MIIFKSKELNNLNVVREILIDNINKEFEKASNKEIKIIKIEKLYIKLLEYLYNFNRKI
jgi:hypothetical protein